MDADGNDPDLDAWRGVDEGWGRRAVEFATLSEPAACREYVALHHRLDVASGDRLLDLACGAGLGLELAAVRGARCSGIDASPRLVAVAGDRVPEADLRVGDIQALPWADASFDVVTSFRGIWGTTPRALAEAHRVLAPGGRLGFTVWGHLKVSPGAWALAPFRLASPSQVANQAAMVALGRPGAGEELLARQGFVQVERHTIPFVWEFADPEAYARALSSTGPAYEAIQAVGEKEFLRHATEIASERVRDGLPLRAAIDVVGYVARKPAERPSSAHRPSGERPTFLAPPEETDHVRRLFADDVDQVGFVMTGSRLWGHLPEQHDALFDLIGSAATAASLTVRQRGILITAAASTMGDSYCSLAWGQKLAAVSSAELAAGVLTGSDEGLSDSERALARWAREVAADPSHATSEGVDALRAAGYDDAQILAVTVFVSLRLAFSTVNDALGVHPEREMNQSVPPEVREVVTWGRPIVAP
jgi:SAM-dependent methyltransferase/alkylhydroperoxidase family enzyme